MTYATARVTRAEHLHRLASQGLTMNEAAAALGITRQAVEQSARRHGVRFLLEAEATLARIRACAAEGLTLKATAARLGRSTKHVGAVASAHGVRFVNSNNRRALRSLTDAQRADYWRAVAKRFSAAEALRIVEARP